MGVQPAPRTLKYRTLVLAASAFFLAAPALAHPLDFIARQGDVAAAPGYIHASTKKPGSGAQSFIDNMAGRAIEFLGNPGMSDEAKRQQFDKLLRDSFDMETIGRFALGRYWSQATEAQRREYMTLFRKMVLNVYAGRFSDYDGQKFETRSARQEGEKDTLVTSFIVPASGPEIQVDWRVRYKDGRYRIVDVIVEGVSMSVTQRSDFAAVIQRGGGNVSVLIDHLRGKV